MSTLHACIESKRPLHSVLATPRLMPSTGQRDPPMVSAQGILPSTTNVMPVPSKARDFVSQGRVHPSPHCCLACLSIPTHKDPKGEIGETRVMHLLYLNPLDGPWHSLSPWL